MDKHLDKWMTVREGYILQGSDAMIRAHQGERYAADSQGQERLSERMATENKIA